MAKGFKQASNSLDEKVSKASEHIAEKTDKPETVELPRVTEPTGSSGGVKFGKGFSPATADVHKKDKADYDTKADYINPIKPTENVAEESVKNPSTYYDKPLPKSKKKSHKGLIIGIAAVIVVCAVVGAGYSIVNLNNGDSGNTSALSNSYSSSGSSSSGDTSTNSTADTYSSVTKSPSTSSKMSASLQNANKIFTVYSSQSDICATQQIPIYGSGKNILCKVDIPKNLDGVGYVGVSGDSVIYDWQNSCRGNLKIAYGSADKVFKNILVDCLTAAYPSIENHYTVYKSGNTENSKTFKEICQDAMDTKGEVYKLDGCEVSDDGEILKVTTPKGYGLSAHYYLDDNVYAITISSTATDSSRRLNRTTGYYGMIKAINYGDAVKVLYYDVSYLDKTKNDYSDTDIQNFKDIEYAMRELE